MLTKESEFLNFLHYYLTVNLFYIYLFFLRTQTDGKDMETEIEGMKIEEESKTKYLGTTVTKDTLIEEETKERIAASN